MGRTLWSTVRRQGNTVASLVGAVIFWEIAVRVAHTPEYILPAPSRVLVDMVSNASVLAQASFFTLQPMVVGFLMAVVLGVLLALLVVYSRAFEAIFFPLLVVLQIIPKIAVAPLFLTWVGYGLLPKVLLVFLLMRMKETHG